MSHTHIHNQNQTVQMTLRVAAGSVDITPEIPCELGGYAARKGVFQGVAERLEINGIVLSDNGSKVVLMTADLLYVTEEIKENVWRDSGANLFVGKDEFVFGASHTHFAPAVDKDKPLLGRVSDAYVRFVIREAANLLRRLLESEGEESHLTYAEGACLNSVNRRRKSWSLTRRRWPFLIRHVRMAPNTKLATDDTVRTFALRVPNGSLVAVIWSYSCHPTASPEKLVISSDYPGACRRIVRERVGVGRAPLPVLFFQGFSGDVSPKPVASASRSATQWMRGKLEALLNRGVFSTFSVAEYGRWVGAFADVLLKTLEVGLAKVVAEPHLAVVGVSLPLAKLVKGGSSDIRLTFRRVDFSPSFHVVAVSAEMVVEYVRLLRREFGDETIMAVGCVEGTYGYLPTDSMIADGGYEGNDFLALFGYESWGTASVEAIVRNALHKLGTAPHWSADEMRSRL